jgi:hypothetical protein
MLQISASKQPIDSKVILGFPWQERFTKIGTCDVLTFLAEQSSKILWKKYECLSTTERAIKTYFVVVEALCYKPEGRGFQTRRGE